MNLFLTLIKALTATLCASFAVASEVILTAVHYAIEIMKSFTVSIAAVVSCFCAVNAATEPDPAPPAIDFEPASQAIDKATRQVDRQVREISKSWGEAHKAMRLAQAAIEVEPPDLSEDMHFNIDVPGPLGPFKDHFMYGFGRAPVQPLVIRSGDLSPDAQSQLQEDLTVMSRILNKAVGPREEREEGDWAMGIVVSSLGGPRRPQSIYLEGYGALFLASVKFPLVAPPKREAADKKRDEAADSEWEQTKQEIYGPRPGRRGVNVATRPEGPKAEYDADRVSELKKSVLEALKNAGNIRDLKQEESITVSITGADVRPGPAVRRLYKSAPGSGAKARMDRDGLSKSTPEAGVNARTERDVVTVFRSDKEPPTSDETHLTIRVTKADAEAFATGKLKFEEFEKKAAVVAY